MDTHVGGATATQTRTVEGARWPLDSTMTIERTADPYSTSVREGVFGHEHAPENVDESVSSEFPPTVTTHDHITVEQGGKQPSAGFHSYKNPTDYGHGGGSEHISASSSTRITSSVSPLLSGLNVIGVPGLNTPHNLPVSFTALNTSTPNAAHTGPAPVPFTPRRHKIKPDPHPYAIITTSTGNLSRSNTLRVPKDDGEDESKAGASLNAGEARKESRNSTNRENPGAGPSGHYKYYVPPVSPGMIPSVFTVSQGSGENINESGGKGRAGGLSASTGHHPDGTWKLSGRHRHKYSESLTDPPRPLPIPPQWTGASSNGGNSVIGNVPVRPQERSRTRSHVHTQRTGETQIQSQQVQAQVPVTAINPNLLPMEPMIPQIVHPHSSPHPPLSSSIAWSPPRMEGSLVHPLTPVPAPMPVPAVAPPSLMSPNITGNSARGGDALPTPIPTPPLPETIRGHSRQFFSPPRLLQSQAQVPEPQAEGHVYHVNGQSFTIQTIKPFHTGSSYGSADGADGRRDVDDEDEDDRVLHASASIMRSPLLRPTSTMSTATVTDIVAPARVEKPKFQFPLTPTTPYESSAAFPINHGPNFVDQSLQRDDASLPSNPKEWSPEDLKTCLYQALGATGYKGLGLESNTNTVIGESSELKNVLAFVDEKQISGKVFLRLDDGDLERYGINPLWRAALMNASRMLRINMLQEQVLLGFSNTEYYLNSVDEHHRSTSDSLTSPSLPPPPETAMLPTPSPGYDESFKFGPEDAPELTLRDLEMDDPHARSYAPPSPLPHSPRHIEHTIPPEERAGNGAVGEVLSRERTGDTMWHASDVSDPSIKEEELTSSGHVGERSRHLEGGDYQHVPPRPTQASQDPQATHQEPPEQEYSRQSLPGMSEAPSTSSAFSIRSASPTRDDNFPSPAYSLARSQSERYPRRSPRQLRLDKSGAVKHKSGRVKGMVESFEKVSTFDELMESPTKSGFNGDGLSRSQSMTTRTHHRNRSSTSSTGGFSVSSGIGGPSGANLSRSNSMSHHHGRSQDRHHFNELVAPSIVGGAGAKVEGYLNRGRSGSSSSNTSASGDEYGWKDTHSYTLVTKKDGRPLPVPPTWTSPVKATRTGNGLAPGVSSPVKGSHWVRNDRRNSQQDSVGVGLGITGIEEHDSIYQRPLPQPPPWLRGTSSHYDGLPLEIATIKPVKAHFSGNISLSSFASASDVFETASDGGSNDLGSVRQVSLGTSDAISEQIEGRHDDLDRRWDGDAYADDPIHTTVRHLGTSTAVGIGHPGGSGPQYTQQPQLPSHFTILTPNDSPTSQSMAQPTESSYIETRSGAPPTLSHYENHHPPFLQGQQADKPPLEVSAEAQPELQQPIPQRPPQLSPSRDLYSRALPIPPTSIRPNTDTKRDEEEELTVEELLASFADDDPMPGFSKKPRQAGGIGGLEMGAGAAAWELADKKQGNTMKHVPAIDIPSVHLVDVKKGHKKSPSTAVTLKDGEAPFIVADPNELVERRTSLQFSEEITGSPQEEFELGDGEERGRAVLRGGRVKGKSGAKSGSTKEVGAEKRVGIAEIFAPPTDLPNRHSPHLEKARAREREREDYKEIGERPDRYRHGKKISGSEKQFREDLARATEELEREKRRREHAETKEDPKIEAQPPLQEQEEDEVIKRLREDMENTRKMVEAVQARVEEVERKVAVLEELGIRHEQDTSTSQSADAEPSEDESEDPRDEQWPASSSWSSLLSSPRTLVHRMLGFPTPHTTDQNKSNASGHRPQHKYPQRAPTSRIPSYVLFVGIGVAAVVLKVVLKRYLVRGITNVGP